MDPERQRPNTMLQGSVFDGNWVGQVALHGPRGTSTYVPQLYGEAQSFLPILLGWVFGKIGQKEYRDPKWADVPPGLSASGGVGPQPQ